jgi:hypothetical protein
MGLHLRTVNLSIAWYAAAMATASSSTRTRTGLAAALPRESRESSC